MPVKLSAIRGEVKKLHFDLGDAGDLNIEYSGKAVKYGDFEALWDQQESTTITESQKRKLSTELILKAVLSWDLQTDEGEVLPITQETIEKLPLSLVLEIVGTVGKELNESAQLPLANAASSPAQ